MQRFLIQAKEERYFELFLLGLATGLRRGEVLALQWDDLNFDTGELRIERQVYRGDGELVISAPKTAKLPCVPSCCRPHWWRCYRNTGNG